MKSIFEASMEAAREAMLFGMGVSTGTTATTGMIDSTLTAESLAFMLENMKSQLNRNKVGHSLSPSPWGLQVKVSPLIPDFKMQAVPVKRYRLSAKGSRRKWVWKGEMTAALIKVPDYTVYQLADGTIVCSPAVADTIRKTLASKD